MQHFYVSRADYESVQSKFLSLPAFFARLWEQVVTHVGTTLTIVVILQLINQPFDLA